MLGQITCDMIRAGPSGIFADGHPQINRVVIGFMGTIGAALVLVGPHLDC
jgi:hypothetical protein